MGSERAADLGTRFNHQTAAVKGVRPHFVTGGEGKPVLLLHGWPQTWWEWRRIMPALAKRFTAKDRRRNTMNIGWKSARVFIALVLLYTCWSACQTNVALAQGSPNGAASQMPAFFNGAEFIVNMFEVPASDPLLAHNPAVNKIWASNDLDEPQDFVPVISAIQGSGFNPLWRQILIVFNNNNTPRQFKSEAEVLAAAANREITLVRTDEVYRCSVVGR
jgi:hypothetical protein